jgi:Dockerin type I domain
MTQFFKYLKSMCFMKKLNFFDLFSSNLNAFLNMNRILHFSNNRLAAIFSSTVFSVKALVLSSALILGSVSQGWAQSNPSAQAVPYLQDFSALIANSTTYPVGIQGWQLNTGGPSTTYRLIAPIADLTLTASSTATANSGGVHNYNGKVGFLQSSSSDPSLVLSIVTTSLSTVSVVYDVMTIRNPYDASANTRINEVTLQYRVGTTGAFTSLSGIEYQNNTTTQTTAVTTPQNSSTKSITLPSACNNQSVVQIRWTSRDVSGAGSRTSFALDNINVNTSATTDYFRSKATGNWGTNATWESSHDGTNWFDATLTPTSAANTITILNSHTVTVASAVTADQITVNTGGVLAAGATLTNASGNLNINGTFQINQGGFGTSTSGTWVYGSSSTLVYNNTSGVYGPIDVNHVYWPSTNGPTNVTVQGVGGINMSVSRTVAGLFQTAASVTLSSATLTLNGTCQINTGGSFANVPIYGSSSLLKYNTGGTYARGNEWSATGVGTIGTTAGYPNDVQLSNSTTLNFPNGSNTNRACNRDLTIDAGSNLYADYSGGSVNLAVGRDISLAGNLSLGGSAGGDLTVKGNWTKTGGTFTPNSRAVFFDAPSGTQTITGVTIFDYLNINKTSGTVTLANNVWVNNTLTLSSGNIVTGINKISIASGGSVTRISGHVVGNLERFIPNTSNPSTTFDIGDATNYTPATVAFVGVTSSSGSITASVTSGDHPSIAGSGINSSKSVNRYWTLTNSGVTGFTSYNPTFTFVSGDVDAGAATANFAIAKYSGLAWSSTTAGVRNATNTQATGVTSFSDFQVGELSSITTSAITGSPFCAGATVSVPYATSGSFTGTFTAQISDASGSFASPVTLGTGASPIAGTIPSNTTTGSGYRIRVINNTPSVVGSDNGSNLTINATITPSVLTAITSGSQTICAGASVTFTATPTNGGTPSYQWKLNGLTNVGTNAATYTSTSLANGDIVTVVMTSTATCPSPTTATSLGITMTVNALPTAGITGNLALNCTIPSTTLTASGGTSYLWSNGSALASSGLLTTGAIFTVTVTSANGCTSSASATTTLDITVPTAGITGNLSLNCTTPSTTLTASGGTSYLWSNGSLVASSGLLTTGATFTVTVTGANGCTSNASATTTLDNTVPTAGITGNLALNCTTPSTTLTASGGTSYLWSNGSALASSGVITTGAIFTVTVTSANGCTSSASVTTTLDNTVPTAGITGNLALNCTTPSTTLTASGGTSYLWSNGSALASSGVITTGAIFTVTVTSANGCASSASVTTTLDNTAPTAGITGNLALNCTTPSTTLTASGGGTYLWSNGSTLASSGVITTGATFTVTVTSANGCTSSASVTTTLDITLPTAGITGNLTLNCTTPSTTLTASGGTSYLWSNGSALASSGVITTGATFTVTVTSANGCTSSVSVTTTLDNTAPTAGITGNLTLNCTTPSTTLTASGGTSYLWSNGSALASSGVITTGAIFTVTVTSSNGCTSSASATTTLDNTVPTAGITGNLALNCTTPSTTLTASGGTSYLWSNGSTLASSGVITTGAIFTVTVTSANGCTSSASVTTTLDNTAPTAGITGNLTLNCTTPSTTLTASGGTSYLWSNGSALASSGVITTGAIFTVTVTSANGCISSASVTTTLNNTAPTASITGNLALTCTTPSTVLTASGGASYVWSDGSTMAASNSITTAGVYSVTVTGANGCTSSASVTTTINNTTPTAIITGNLALTCTTPSTVLTASGGASYVWSDGSTVAASNSITTAGVYSVMVTGANGCISSASVTTTINNTTPIASITGNLALTCTTPTTVLTASGGTSYVWSDGSTMAASNSITTAGVYSVTVTGANGCTSTTSATTTLNNTTPIASITGNLALTCTTPSTVLTASGGTSYVWSDGSTMAASNSITTAGVYSVTVTGANGCTSTTSATTTLNNTTPTASITGNLALTCTTPSTVLTASGGTSYVWSDGSTMAASNSITTAGVYTVTVTGANGCTSTTSATTTLNNTTPIASITGNLALTCTTPSTVLTASGGTSYVWSDGSTMAASNSITTAGVYSVTVTGANGCTSTTSATTTLDNTAPTAPSVSSTLQPTCTVATGKVTLTTIVGKTYAVDGGTYQTSGVFAGLSSGSHNFTAKNAAGCESTVTNVLINAQPASIITSATPTQITCSSAGSVTVSVTSGGVSPFTYTDGTTSNGTGIFSGLTAGTYNYTVTDANGCTATATATINVGPSCLTLAAKVFLEGAYDATNTNMKDQLRQTTAGNVIPLSSSTVYAGTFQTATASVFTVSGSDAIVDWVLVELRDATTPTTVIASKAALIQKDGDIVDADGVSNLLFINLVGTNFIVAINHRNHLSVRTANALSFISGGTPTQANFTDASLTLYTDPAITNTPQKVVSGVKMMWVGDANRDGRVNAIDYNNLYIPQVTQQGYRSADFNLDGRVNAIDYNLFYVPNTSKRRHF